jgi:hypothetical protein
MVDYWIIDNTGALRSMVTVPANVTLMAVSDSNVWGVVRDEFDVPSVIRYQISR